MPGTDPQHRVLGLVTDPDMPTQIGGRLLDHVTRWLEERTGSAWKVDQVSDPITASDYESEKILQAVNAHRQQYGWECAIYVTDLPLLLPRGPLIADISAEGRVALISFPALGALRSFRRTRQAIEQVLDDLLTRQEQPDEDSGEGHRLENPLTRALAPVERIEQPKEWVDVRYASPRRRGWVRLATGMVRANRPWRMVWGLSNALAASLAAAGFGLFTSTVWQLGDTLTPLRATGTTLFAIGLMIGWLIASHDLWERVGRRAVRDRRLAVLYNASTVTSLSFGVLSLYALVFLVSIAGAATVINPQVLGSTLGHPPDASAYLRLAWMLSSMALIAGALGSSLESDAAVCQAAYGYRERQRREKYAQKEKEQERENRS